MKIKSTILVESVNQIWFADYKQQQPVSTQKTSQHTTQAKAAIEINNYLMV